MKCPVCGCSNYDDMQVCSFCGSQLIQEEQKTFTGATTNFNIAPTYNMTFHYIFCIITLWGGASIFSYLILLPSVMSSFSKGDEIVATIAIAFTLANIAIQAVEILKAILLLKRKALGYKMQRIVSWTKVFIGIIGVAIAVFTAFLGSGSGQYDGLWYIVSLILGFGSIPLIVWETIALSYYKKRKELFVN